MTFEVTSGVTLISANVMPSDSPPVTVCGRLFKLSWVNTLEKNVFNVFAFYLSMTLN